MQADVRVDAVIIGGGFAGSLLAAILSTQGQRVVLLERGRHPRFAVGESSTPTANFLLRQIARSYGLDWLEPLAKYGSWNRTYPQVMNGLKRGFSYFQHRPLSELRVDARHENELLVAASSSDEFSDTQWLRADVDAFLFDQARAAGADVWQQAQQIELAPADADWRVTCSVEGRPLAYRTPFLVDASGSSEVLVKRLCLPLATHALATQSRSVFGHFRDLSRWADVLAPLDHGSLCEHPFGCDDAALHHVLDEGWMWWIRFRNNVTSVGIVLDTRHPRAIETRRLTPDAEWEMLLSRYPTLWRAISSAELDPATPRLIRTGRLQRCIDQTSGANWALLPHTAGFIDPLYSSGIALSLAGVDRLANVLLSTSPGPEREQRLAAYSRVMRDELRLIDLFVSGAYEAIRQHSFRKFVAYSMCYFGGATTWERCRTGTELGVTPPLFLADDPEFVHRVRHLKSALRQNSDSQFEATCRDLLRPVDVVGLFDPPRPNMYGATAVPEDTGN